MSALKWTSVFQGCPQGGVPLYYNNTGIPCVCGCVCGVLVISEFSGTGRRSDKPLSTTWRASSGELERLHLESTGSVLRERKPLEFFRW